MTPSWQCPECGRTFVRKTREHSCQLTSVESHLEKAAPAVREAYRVLEELLERLGEHRIVPLRSMLTVGAKRNFAGIRVLRDRLDLGFFLERSLESARVTKTERLSPRKIAYHVDIASPDEVDAEIEQWLAEAHRLGVAASLR